MWKAVLFITIYCLGYSANAQQPALKLPNTTSGRWLVSVQTGGLLSSKNANDIGEDFFHRTLTPSFGYFIRKDLVVGIGIPIGGGKIIGTHYSQTGVYYTDIIPKQIGIQPFVQKYFGTGRLKPFVSASYSYNNQILNYRISPLSVNIFQKGNRSEISLIGGLTYFLTSRFGFDISAQYAWQSGNRPYIVYTSGGYFRTYPYNRLTISANTGLRYLLGK